MKKISVIACILLTQYVTRAQDTHYWTQQFGTRSALLGGAVVGGVRDNSMIFYNPAAIAFIDSSSFSINANFYQAENTKVENILTQEKEFTSLQLTSVPLLTSGQFKTKVPNLRISYGIFSPAAFQFRGQAHLTGMYPVVPDDESPGEEAFVGDINLFTRMRELDVAFGVSYKLNEHWSIGLTHLFGERNHFYNRSVFTYYLLNNTDQTLVSRSLTQGFNYYNVRYMPKLGIAFRGNKWSWGATATAPGINIMGTGAVGVDILGNNVKAAEPQRSTIIINNRQTKLKSQFKSPYSVATGFEFRQGRNAFLVSAQYFGEQKVYTILQGDQLPFVVPASAASLIGNEALLQVKTAARPVLNIAVGFERSLNETVSLNASFRNNQSYYDPQLLQESGIRPDISTWDIYHAVGGVTIRKQRSSLSLGLAFGFGSDKARKEQYLPLLSETDIFKNPTTVTQASYTSLGFLMGYNYFFKKG